jgi:hypothetical protein
MTCVDRNCQAPLDPGWDYCPVCGLSQNDRWFPPNDCVHEFVPAGPYCVRCGFAKELDREQKVLGVALTAAGLFLLALCCAVMGLGRNQGLVRLASYLFFPAAALLAYGTKLLIPYRG